ncbi:uncharacterized protein GVI51_K08085 [Nakaseomyces glabratus]|uniref:Uncharacterized protein n=1 Tax=Candida glabrata (strain ATCC 2001 / BCRC 20586 / JCM 3761 / NBRC 0622 / NRRL Y-65 / CBS 138) TaxID=284593 RepID=Q6FMG5_CANGA|nr:uncharacterized protein CAGL0K08228g [Nakaseomyces glabratus]KAH7597144.1 Organic solute transporter Ostalpha [Nakaseomyces glabratus]KAH7602916.1 Organic solute transporter Ostalpha [Nakaseomyces glabratus]KAI8383774.1 Organic solute transporter Ostalpha [Nakaseomyces glabratus]KAI8394718.1 Organic solute transporter Ostalpha [Nakaseomyces glabratus]KAJ9572724.1 hypothetical protein LTX96_0000927 [Nakaseomyces glabratus]|eukprot:XP_448579.1 uncharacterized protein CAGL0K08228g [[Candida] glabrata]
MGVATLFAELLNGCLAKYSALFSMLAMFMALYTILRHLMNYRKPYEQRLSIRILIVVPIFCITCLLSVLFPFYARRFVDPIREVYEAVVIYTFFSLLITYLGGEYEIISRRGLKHQPVNHFVPLVGQLLKKVDISNPNDFLWIKRGILQYVWFKPIYSISMICIDIWGLKQFEIALVVLFNISVSLSLYELALFWKCLYQDLLPFHPWPKFLCVKLIIFVSYWQGLIIQVLGYYRLLGKSIEYKHSELGYIYRNALLCFEMIGFAYLHQKAFPWEDYSIKSIPMGARMKLRYAIRDCFGIQDLIWDSKQALNGNTYYNYRNFDPSVETSLLGGVNRDTRIDRINEGLRFTNNGESRYWIDYGAIESGAQVSESIRNTDSAKDISADWDDSIDTSRYVQADPNYPVVWNIAGARYTNSTAQLRNEIIGRSSSTN